MELKFVRDKYVRFSDMIFAVLDRILLLVVVGAVFAVGTFAVAYVQGQGAKDKTPSYMTSSTIYVGAPAGLASEVTYSEIAMSDEVLDDIIKNYNLGMTREEIWDTLYSNADLENTMVFTVITDDQELTCIIMEGLLEYAIPRIESVVPDAHVTVLKKPQNVRAVHSTISPTAYSREYLSLKGIPSGSVVQWDTYVQDATNTNAMLKKGIAIGVVMAFLIAVVLVVMNIFSRKLRYPDEFNEACGARVLVTGGRDKTGLNTLAAKLGDFTGNKTILLFADHKGEGTSTVATALKTAYDDKHKRAKIFMAKEIVDDPSVLTDESTECTDVIIIDAPSIEESMLAYESVKYADDVILVTNPGRLNDIQLHAIMDEIKEEDGELTGIVLNKAKVNQYGRKSRYLGTYFCGEK